MMKIYKGEKNYDKMEKLSEKLMKNADIQMVGMKAAVEAQMEKKEFKVALATVNKAFELRQDLYWIIESAYELRAKGLDEKLTLNELSRVLININQRRGFLSNRKSDKQDKDNSKFHIAIIFILFIRFSIT